MCLFCWCAAVDGSYAGPRLEEEISAEFMVALLDWLKDQKILHRKYAYKVGGCGHVGVVTRAEKEA